MGEERVQTTSSSFNDDCNMEFRGRNGPKYAPTHTYHTVVSLHHRFGFAIRSVYVVKYVCVERKHVCSMAWLTKIFYI